MDFSNATRPAPVSTLLAPARTEVVATEGSVAVDLPPEQTVQSARAGDAVRVDIRSRDDQGQTAQRQRDDASAQRAQTETRGLSLQRQQDARERAVETRDVRESDVESDLQDTVEQRLVIEPRTRSVVIQKRDSETGETVQLVPDAATLKLRIYARLMADRDRAAAESRLFERTA